VETFREVSNRINFGEKRLSDEDVGFRVLKKRATSTMMNQPAPELSKRRQIELLIGGRITVDAQEKD
jgi:hypothetical protein